MPPSLAKIATALALALVGCGLPGAAAAGESCAKGPPPDVALASGNMTVVCDEGCYDTEDEACHQGLSPNQCAEIYGHVEWSAKCNCRTEEGVSLDQKSAQPRAAASVNLYFSVPAFVVLFRESLEVCIVLVIIVQFLTKAKDDGTITEELFRRLRREVYVGAAAGFVACLIMGVGFLAVASLARGLFRCDGLLVFDGIIMMLTCVVLTFLALNFYKMIYTKEAHELKMKRTVDEAIEAAREGESQAGFGKKHAFLVFAFTTGLREGLESIIFLVGVISDFKDPSYVSSLPLPIITALILSRIVGCIFFQGTKKMKVEHFMRFCSILLLFISAGFFSSSMHKWQELSLFGTWSPLADRPWQNQKVFDASDCCNDKTNRFFVLMRALLGWQDQPTPVEFFAYGLYWIIAVSVGVVLVHRAKKGIAARLKELRQAAQTKEDNIEQLQSEKVGQPQPVEERAPPRLQELRQAAVAQTKEDNLEQLQPDKVEQPQPVEERAPCEGDGCAAAEMLHPCAVVGGP